MSTAIEWTDDVWNPSTGCTKVSPGCAHCYAETITKRYVGSPGWPETFLPWVPGNDTLVLHPDRLEAPLHWKKPRRVFVNSMSDLFHEDVPFDFIDRVFAVIALTPQHTYQVLTKRPQRMREYILRGDQWKPEYEPEWPLGNCWLGVTVENQRWADERIPILLDTPAAVRFVSAEPLLQDVEIRRWLPGYVGCTCVCGCQVSTSTPGLCTTCMVRMGRGHDCGTNFDEPHGRLDWVIVGGESGPKHRPFDPDWARSIVSQCRDAGVACFVKQLGGARPGNALEDLPEDLQVREFPEVSL